MSQVAFRLEHPAGTLPLLLRIQADERNRRAAQDWSSDRDGWVSANGWTIRPRQLDERHAADRRGWALDPVTAMVRAEGGS